MASNSDSAAELERKAKLYDELGLFELPHHSMVEKWYCRYGRDLWHNLQKFIFFTRYQRRFLLVGVILIPVPFFLHLVLITVGLRAKPFHPISISPWTLAPGVVGLCVALVPFYIKTLMRRTSREFREDVIRAGEVVSDLFVDLLAKGKRKQAEAELKEAYYSGSILPAAMCDFVRITARSDDPVKLLEITREYDQASRAMFYRALTVFDIAHRFGFELEDPSTAVEKKLNGIVDEPGESKGGEPGADRLKI